MKILIIGSKGFIGQHLHNALKETHELWCCDVVVDYTSLNYFQIDASTSDFLEVFQKQTYDVCVNCSGAASVPDSIINPHRDYILNTSNVFKILEAIRKHNNNCKFINLSSAAVYGNPLKLPIEEKGPLTPLSPYGNHKLFSEQICKEFYLYFGIQTLSLRIFSAYGPGLQKQLFWDLYQKAKTPGIITLFGTGRESRDFIYIDDLTTAIAQIILHGDFDGESINVANGEEITIKEAVDTFYTIYNPTIIVRYTNEIRNGDPANWKADINKLKKIGYNQKTSLEDGLKKYITWLHEKE